MYQIDGMAKSRWVSWPAEVFRRPCASHPPPNYCSPSFREIPVRMTRGCPEPHSTGPRCRELGQSWPPALGTLRGLRNDDVGLGSPILHPVSLHLQRLHDHSGILCVQFRHTIGVDTSGNNVAINLPRPNGGQRLVHIAENQHGIRGRPGFGFVMQQEKLRWQTILVVSMKRFTPRAYASRPVRFSPVSVVASRSATWRNPSLRTCSSIARVFGPNISESSPAPKRRNTSICQSRSCAAT